MRSLILPAGIMVLAILPQAGPSQWGPRGCAAPAGPVGSYASGYRWEFPAGYTNQVALMRGSQQLGNYSFEDGLYYPYDGRRWSLVGESHPPAGAPPVPGVVGQQKKAAKPAVGEKRVMSCDCSEGCFCEAETCDCRGTGKLCHPRCPCTVGSDKIREPVTTPRQDFGVSWSPSGPEKYTYKGEPVRRSDAVEMIEKGVPDDRGKLRLTVIGSEAERKRVVDDVARSPMAGQLLVQAYAPDHWAVKDAGFKTDGHPTVYVQAPAGQVLHRQDDYSDGAEGLLAAVRKADPNYRPDKDPDLRKKPEPKPEPPLIPTPFNPLAWIQAGWQWLLIAGAALLTWFLTPKRQVAS